MLRTILYTREDSCPEAIKKEFQEVQVNIIEVPMIKTVGLAHELPTETIDWIFFTSPNTIRYLNQGLDLKKIKVASIGKKTSDALRKKGILIDFEPTEAVAEVMSLEWLATQSKKQTVFLPNSTLAREIIPKMLENEAHRVIEKHVYQTFFPSESKAKLKEVFRKKEIMSGIFASPSAWHHFKQVADEEQVDLSEWSFYSIGTITTQAIEKTGEVVSKQSTIYDMSHLYEVILKEIKNNGKIHAS
ncbi:MULTISPECIES: uroporphyrinogen-III synthase [Vagococcus]|nr:MULTISPECIES: uroporphyrinogen-III synthase [Vagococcus]HCM89665.1 uroporphyrinogen-III synthase [Vagococcus sp.]